MMGEYDAGYENCIDSMVRQMEDMQFRIDSLHRENVKLHAELTDLRLGSCPSCGIKVENERLRELVRAMWLYDYAGKFSSASDDVEHVAMVYQSMRKLGVEL